MTNSRPFNPQVLHNLINQIEASPDDLIELVKQFELDPKTDLVGINLQGANLRGVDLKGFVLDRAQLQNANLRGAVLAG